MVVNTQVSRIPLGHAGRWEPETHSFHQGIGLRISFTSHHQFHPLRSCAKKLRRHYLVHTHKGYTPRFSRVCPHVPFIIPHKNPNIKKYQKTSTKNQKISPVTTSLLGTADAVFNSMQAPLATITTLNPKLSQKKFKTQKMD